MDTQTLIALEHAIEPYRSAGFIVVSQSEGAITLVSPPEKFNYLYFIAFLMLFWPLAVYYAVSFNNRRNRSVCARVTSQGYIEESGYTLDVVARERRRERWVGFALIAIFLLLALSAIAVLFSPQSRL